MIAALATIVVFAVFAVLVVFAVFLWEGASLLVYAAVNGVLTVRHRIRERSHD